MEYAYDLCGAAPVKIRHQVAATVSNPGIPLLVPAAGGAGVALGTTTGADGMIGVNLDTATYVTAQQTDGSSAERTVEVIVNPNAVWEAKLSGGATEDTALTLYDVTAVSTTGLVITTGDDWTSPEFDEGVVWGYDGANVGQIRKITSTDTTLATLTVALDQDTVVGDNFLRAPFFKGGHQTVTLTTNLFQVDASAAVAATTAALRCVDFKLRDGSDEGRNNSFVLLISGNHSYGGVLN